MVTIIFNFGVWIIEEIQLGVIFFHVSWMKTMFAWQVFKFSSSRTVGHKGIFEGWISWLYWHDIPEILERFSEGFSGDSEDSDGIPEILVRFQRFYPSKWPEIPTVIHPRGLLRHEFSCRGPAKDSESVCTSVKNGEGTDSFLLHEGSIALKSSLILILDISRA